MKVLVTGAAGFIGSHLFDHLLKEGHEVWGVDNYSLGSYTHPRILSVDLLNKDAIDAVIKLYRPELVYHLAAWAHEGLSAFCPTLITENNYNAYLNTLTSAIRYGVKKIVLCSSMSVYGDQIPPFDEDMRRKPRDIYAISKSAMEEATEVLSEVYGFKYVIIRPHNVYGERQVMTDPYRNVVAIFINRALQGGPLYIYGDGEQRRAFTYVSDIILPIAYSGTGDLDKEVINVGPLKDYSVNELAKEVCKYFPDIEIKYLPERPLEVKYAFSTHEKAVRLLNQKDSTTLQGGLERMISWAQKEGPWEYKFTQLELENERTPDTWINHL